MLHLHPKTPAIQYHATQDMLIEQATRFALFGVGLKEQAVKRYYNPKVLSLLAGLPLVPR
jgi:hypothetical protein